MSTPADTTDAPAVYVAGFTLIRSREEWSSYLKQRGIDKWSLTGSMAFPCFVSGSPIGVMQVLTPADVAAMQDTFAAIDSTGSEACPVCLGMGKEAKP